MSFPPFQTYADWRALSLGPVLSEPTPATAPAERLLQWTWLHQRLRRDALRTADGRPVVVLHPGFWNREPGPDFHHAVLQIGTGPADSGDVEIDLSPSCWHAHGHDRNPAFRHVRLHVVWSGTPSPALAIPTLVLRDALDAPLDQLRDSFGSAGAVPADAVWPGACAAPLASLPDAALPELLAQAAQTRLRLKAGRLAARARQAGWEAALWEELFAALGFKHNAWPMRRLAELLPRLLADLDPAAPRTFVIQVRLLGLAGLLPEPGPATDSVRRDWLERAWHLWWRWRGEATDLVLPAALWHRAGIRPANQPARRLALAAHWVAEPGWCRRWEHWLAHAPSAGTVPRLHALLTPPADPFWETHWSLTSPPLRLPRPLLGATRTTDLAINVLLPWLWGRAVAGGDVPLRLEVERRYLAWPPAQDNAVLRLARRRLLGVRPFPGRLRAAHQQGFLQIARDFCATANALCDGCRLPGLLTTPP